MLHSDPVPRIAAVTPQCKGAFCALPMCCQVRDCHSRSVTLPCCLLLFSWLSAMQNLLAKAAKSQGPSLLCLQVLPSSELGAVLSADEAQLAALGQLPDAEQVAEAR